MRWQSVFALSVVAAITVGCELQNLGDYQVADDLVEGGAGGAGGNATSCKGSDGTVFSVGQSEPCDQTEDGKPVVYGATVATGDAGVDDGGTDAGDGGDGGDDDGGAATNTSICHRGTRECLPSGAFAVCKGAVGKAPRDITSTADNDCDGTPDIQQGSGCVKSDNTQAHLGDTESCFTFAAPARPIGVCKSGTKTCRAKADKSAFEWSDCAGQVGPTSQTDLCGASDNGDENCDGSNRQGCSCTNGQTQACACNGTQSCLNGKFSACTVTPPATYGNACSAGRAGTPCYRTGHIACNGTCDAAVIQPGARACNSNVDNDCSGTVDNAEPGCKCDGTVPVGNTATCYGASCGSGSKTCNANGSGVQWSGCTLSNLPTVSCSVSGYCSGSQTCQANGQYNTCTGSNPVHCPTGYSQFNNSCYRTESHDRTYNDNGNGTDMGYNTPGNGVGGGFGSGIVTSSLTFYYGGSGGCYTSGTTDAISIDCNDVNGRQVISGYRPTQCQSGSTGCNGYQYSSSPAYSCHFQQVGGWTPFAQGGCTKRILFSVTDNRSLGCY